MNALDHENRYELIERTAEGLNQRISNGTTLEEFIREVSGDVDITLTMPALPESALIGVM